MYCLYNIIEISYSRGHLATIVQASRSRIDEPDQNAHKTWRQIEMDGTQACCRRSVVSYNSRQKDFVDDKRETLCFFLLLNLVVPAGRSL